MSYDKDKVAEMALALMFLTSWKEKGGGVRAWKSLSWDITDHLFEYMISALTPILPTILQD